MGSTRKLGIIQSSYIPWKGYFDIIHDVDVFIFFDDAQYTIRDWRNRNKIKTNSGTKWLSVPVEKQTSYRTLLICQMQICAEQAWQRKHFRSFETNYSKAKYYADYKYLIEDFYLDKKWESLSEMNIYMTRKICDVFGITAEFYNSKDFDFDGIKTDKLVNMCKHFEADHYLSGPAAKDYIEPEKFEEADIALEYKDYSGYPEYNQLYPPFDHYVTVLDVIFNCGPEAAYHIWGWREQKP